ncbi:MAG: hypothetical protein KGJ34_02210 [Patescibacteria group bacterium]|nr:hypothetical protein [Patescibacteria group bacterium]
MRRTLLVCLVLICFPLAAAADAGVGFATQSVFLSRSAVTDGDQVLIYASVTNPTSEAFQGKVVFDDGSNELGNVSTMLTAGEARVVSISWSAAPGTQTIAAKLEDESGATIATEEATFIIAPKPTASSNTAAAVESSTPIQQALANISPQAASAAAPAFSAIDNARQSLANTIDQQIAATKPKLLGQVLGAQTQNTSPANASAAANPNNLSEWILSVFWTIYYYLLMTAQFVVDNAWIFYPFVAILFLYFLYRLYRKMS